MRAYLALLAAVLLFGCTTTPPTPPGDGNGGDGCICTAIYKPVCGTDGKTYSSACVAGCAKVGIAYQGECSVPGKDCQDSDGGKDVMVKGTAVADGKAYLDGCADGAKVSEYFCEGGLAKVEAIACPLGYSCKEGLCQKDIVPPPPPEGCSDGDGGKDFYVAATVSSGGKSYNDECTDLKLVKEYYCQDNAAANEIHQCDSGERCENGRCVKPESSCTDSDGGDDIYQKGKVVSGTIINPIDRADACVDEDTVREYFCVGTDYASDTEDCPSDLVCDNGECDEADCTDSDGSDTSTKGTVTKGSNTYNDSCPSTNTVREYTCDGKDVESDNIACSPGYYCDSGKCVAYPV